MGATPEELYNWAMITDDDLELMYKSEDNLSAENIDVVLEYLRDNKLLNKEGMELAHSFWERYIKEGEDAED